MLSSFFPTGSPRSSECSNVRHRHRMSWLDFTMATVLIKNCAGCLLHCCDFSSEVSSSWEVYFSLFSPLILLLRMMKFGDIFCLTFINYDVGLTAPAATRFNNTHTAHTHAHMHAVCLPFPHCQPVSQWRLCHSILITSGEVSASSHRYISQPPTAAALSAKKEKGRDVLREGERNDSSLWRRYPPKQLRVPVPAIVCVDRVTVCSSESPQMDSALAVLFCHLTVVYLPDSLPVWSASPYLDSPVSFMCWSVSVPTVPVVTQFDEFFLSVCTFLVDVSAPSSVAVFLDCSSFSQSVVRSVVSVVQLCTLCF